MRTNGAFYFLARLPEGVGEEEAVRVLATEHRVLCTPGRCVMLLDDGVGRGRRTLRGD